MKINKKMVDSKWCKFDGKVEFLIRPFKFSEFKMENVSLGLREQFTYCVIDWKGLTNEDGKTEFKCTLENKEFLYDYYDDVRNFVFNQTKKRQEGLGKEIKN